MGSSSWAWRRAWRARSMAWWPPKCRGRSRTAGSPVVSRWSARGRRRSPARRPRADSHASRGGRPAISRAGSPPCSESSMPCMFDGPTAIGVDETSCRKGAHVHHRGRRPQAQTGRLGARRIRQGGARPVLPAADRRAARLHQGSHRRRSRMDRRQREGAPAERRARPGLVPHRLPDERRARPGQETVAEPGPRGPKDGHGDDARRQIRRAQEPGRISPNGRTRIPGASPTGHGNSRNSPGMLPHQPVGQAEAELKRWIFRASHSRIPEIVEPCRKTRRRKDDIPKTIRPDHSNARPEAFRKQDQGHHPHGLRLPTRRQPHRHDQTPMQRPTHPPTNIHPLTHENSRRLIFLNGSCEDVDPKSWLQRKVAYHGIWESGKIWQIMLTD